MMMKKLLLLLFIYVGYSQIALCGEQVFQINLTCFYHDPAASKGGIKRAPAKRAVVYLSGQTVSFPAFASDCTFELADAVTEEVVYSQYIPASQTSCNLLTSMEGMFVLRFIFEQYTLEGYVEF